ncbi:MAG: hypothetical protein M1837_002060 [Sclerophora amabilis]|nr:MAG: hypothetical protein M1837_002060 [Sclerophora amabilis]
MAVGKKLRSRSKSGMQPRLMIRTTQVDPSLNMRRSESLGDLEQNSSFGLVDELPSLYDQGLKLFPGRLHQSQMQVAVTRSYDRGLTFMVHPPFRFKYCFAFSGQATEQVGISSNVRSMWYVARSPRSSSGCVTQSFSQKSNTSGSGHCRRRKIRCLLPSEDSQGRCSNCIRLKKECNFFPVDQQPQPERRSRARTSVSRTPRGTPPSPSLSPSQLHGPTFSHRSSSFAHFSPAQMSLGSSQQGFSPHASQQQLNDNLGSIHKASLIPQGYDLTQDQRHIPWEGPLLDRSPASTGTNLSAGTNPSLEDPSTNFWRLSDHPSKPPFGSFSGPSGPTGVPHRSNNAFPYPSPREEVNWPSAAAARSMSYGQVEGIHTNLPNQYFPRQEMHTPVSDLYSPNSNNTRSASMVSISEPPAAPVDGQPLHGLFGAQSIWNPSFMANTMTGMTGKGAEGVGGWYQEPATLTEVDDEDMATALHEGAPMYYPQTSR